MSPDTNVLAHQMLQEAWFLKKTADWTNNMVRTRALWVPMKNLGGYRDQRKTRLNFHGSIVKTSECPIRCDPRLRISVESNTGLDSRCERKHEPPTKHLESRCTCSQRNSAPFEHVPGIPVVATKCRDERCAQSRRFFQLRKAVVRTGDTHGEALFRLGGRKIRSCATRHTLARIRTPIVRPRTSQSPAHNSASCGKNHRRYTTIDQGKQVTRDAPSLPPPRAID